MNPSPPAGVVDLQVFAQFGIPGAWSQGALSLVPLFVSAPAAEMKKQLVTPEGTPAGQVPPAAKALTQVKSTPQTVRADTMPRGTRWFVPIIFVSRRVLVNSPFHKHPQQASLLVSLPIVNSTFGIRRVGSLFAPAHDGATKNRQLSGYTQATKGSFFKDAGIAWFHSAIPVNARPLHSAVSSWRAWFSHEGIKPRPRCWGKINPSNR